MGWRHLPGESQDFLRGLTSLRFLKGTKITVYEFLTKRRFRKTRMQPLQFSYDDKLPYFYNWNYNCLRNVLCQGPRSKFSSGGAKEESVKENFFWGGGGMLVDFYSISLKRRRMRITIKLLIFFHIFSDVAIGSENSPSLN